MTTKRVPPRVAMRRFGCRMALLSILWSVLCRWQPPHDDDRRRLLSVSQSRTLSFFWSFPWPGSGPLFLAEGATIDEQDGDGTSSSMESSSDGDNDSGKTKSALRRRDDEDIDEGTETKGTRRGTAKDARVLLPSPAVVPPTNFRQILLKAWNKALGGGIPGAIAGVVQVLMLMWLRTVINYQSRYGTNFSRALSILYKEGGIRRFYRGLGFALFQAPLSRFVATASNDGVLSLLTSLPATRHWAAGIKTFFASFVVGVFRMGMMPVDTAKTVLQVDSIEGFQSLIRRVKGGDIGALYQGAWATALSSSVGHYPWFTTFNALSSALWLQELVPYTLVRNSIIGLVSSIVSDTVVNVFRVVKTTKQSLGAKHSLTYADTIRMIVASDGWKGLFGRGLRTRILANALQSIVFTTIWRGLAEHWGKNQSYRGSLRKKNMQELVESPIRGSDNDRVDDDHHPPPHQVDHRTRR